MRTKIALLTLTAAALTLAACGSSGSNPAAGGGKSAAQTGVPHTTGTGSPAQTSTSGSSPTCAAVQVGPITRCTNFYTDFWPTIEKHMQELWAQAKTTDGGNFVLWDYNEENPKMMAMFSKKYPGLHMTTRGFTYNLPSALLAAHTTGARSSDIASGTLGTAYPLWSKGLWKKIDWTQFGVPKEYTDPLFEGMIPAAISGQFLWYNKSAVAKLGGALPTATDDLAKPEFAKNLAMAGYQAEVFAGYGMKNGKDAMLALVDKVKANGVTKTYSSQGMVGSGEKAFMIGSQLTDDNPNLVLKGLDNDLLWMEVAGVNGDAKNVPAAELFALWRAFDPDWLKVGLTDKDLISASIPYPGLPESIFATMNDLKKENWTVMNKQLLDGSAVLFTKENTGQISDLGDAAFAEFDK